MTAGIPALVINDLVVEYKHRDGWLRAVDGAGLTVRSHERVGLVGESGSGKSTLALAAMRLLPSAARVPQGTIEVNGRDITGLSERDMRELRGSSISMIYQDPFTYLNPVMRVGDQVAESLLAHQSHSRKDAADIVIRLLDELHLPDPRQLVKAYPHQLSGGQLQRIVIASALVCEPSIVIADEPTTALDVTVQAQILRTLNETVTRRGTSLLLITHDLAIVRALCDRVVVMYAGEVVESGPVAETYANPQHPYTAALLAASNRLVEPRSRFRPIPGQAPSLAALPNGCRFAPRCEVRVAKNVTEALEERPPLFPTAAGHLARCWLYKDGNVDEAKLQ